MCPGKGKFAPSLRIDLLIGMVQIAEHCPFFTNCTPRFIASIVASAWFGFGLPGVRGSTKFCLMTVREFLSMLEVSGGCSRILIFIFLGRKLGSIIIHIVI